MRRVSFTIEEELLDKLDMFLIDRALTRSEAIRRAIRDYLRRNVEIRTRRLRIYH